MSQWLEDLIGTGAIVVREQRVLNSDSRHVLHCQCGELLPKRDDLTPAKWMRHCKQSAKHKDWHRRAQAPVSSTAARASSTAAPSSSSPSGFRPFESGPHDYGTAAATTDAQEVIVRESTLIYVHTAAAAAAAHGVIVQDAAVISAQVPHPWALP